MGLFSFLGCTMVPASRLESTADGVHFPTVSGSNLQRVELEFPRDFEGEVNLLFVPFYQRQQADVNTWLPFAEELETQRSDLIYYELPTIDERPTLSRTFINEGMRAGIPNPKARDRTVTLYIDLDQFTTATGIDSKDVIHVLLVDCEGGILWRARGPFRQEEADDLRQFLESR